MIAPRLWSNKEVEEAGHLYVSLFASSRVTGVSHCGEAMPLPKETVMSATSRLAGQEFTSLNGGPVFRFAEAASFFVHCEMQGEVDRLWAKLSEGRPGSVRPAQGQRWPVVEDRPERPRRADRRPGS